MKRVILLSTVSSLMALGSALAATETTTREMNVPSARSWNAPSFIVSAGASFSEASFHFDGDESSGVDRGMRTGLSASLGLEMPMSSTFSILPSIAYIQKGMTLKSTVAGVGSAESTIRMNYLELPVMGVLYFSEKSNAGRGFLTGGAYMGKTVGARTVKSETTLVGQPPETDVEDIKEDTFSFDYGMRVGVGFDMPMQSGSRIILGINYEHGLKNIAQDTKSGEYMRNRAFLASAGFAF